MSERRTRTGSDSVGWYLARRIGQALFVLWAAFTVSFLIMYALPSDPVALMAGTDNNVPPEQLEELSRQYGLDRPLVVQYGDKLTQVLRGDLGRSIQSGRPVSDIITEAVPSTLQITGLALLLAVLGGGALAFGATATRNRWLSSSLLALPPLGVAVPTFWLGLLLLQQFAFTWPLFPPLGNEGWRSAVLPAIALAVPTGAMVAQVLSKSLQSTMRQPYIDTARAKGASPRRVHFRHALRNAALPALTMAGIIVGQLLSGSVVAETVFSRDGLGRITANAVGAQDIPVVMGLVVFGATVFVLANVAVDVVYPLLDPRIVRVRRARPTPAVVAP